MGTTCLERVKSMTVLKLQVRKSGRRWHKDQIRSDPSAAETQIYLLTCRPLGLQKSGSYISYHAKKVLLQALAELHS